jgi:hypothetical protein
MPSSRVTVATSPHEFSEQDFERDFEREGTGG